MFGGGRYGFRSADGNRANGPFCRGEPLRKKTDPSVSELLVKRPCRVMPPDDGFSAAATCPR